MKSNPKVTVLMPVYNVALYVREAINSILNQTFSDFELLIINDGSTDTTRDEVLKFTDIRIRFVENEKNIGLANTLNRGIELAQGEYIARMDGDDISLPERLQKQVTVLDEHPDIDICGAGYQFFGAKSYDVIYPQYHEEIKAGLLFGCCMIIPLFRRKSIINENLHYEQEFFPAEDYRFWTHCVLKLKLYNIPEILFHYRMHPTQVSELMTNQSEMTVRVKEFYSEMLFPRLNESKAHDFVRDFNATIQSFDDVAILDRWINLLILEGNDKQTIDLNIFRLCSNRVIVNKLRGFIVDRWFSEKYNIRQYIKLFNSDVYLRLPFNFRLKLLVKSILNRNK